MGGIGSYEGDGAASDTRHRYQLNIYAITLIISNPSLRLISDDPREVFLDLAHSYL